MSLHYIRQAYGVPAFRGQRIRYTTPEGVVITGAITMANGSYISVKMDCWPKDGKRRENLRLHPTWNIEYL